MFCLYIKKKTLKYDTGVKLFQGKIGHTFDFERNEGNAEAKKRHLEIRILLD